LTRVSNPRKVALTVPDAGRFRNAAGQYVLSLRVERLDGGGAPRPAAPNDMANMLDWSFEDVDVTLKGTCR
jgi:hypothetical protein